MTSRESSLRKIKREARLMTLAGASCPGVVRLFDTFEEREVVHLVTEVCRGGDLRRHVEAHGPLGEAALGAVAAEVLKIVRDCHALGIMYADVKPANFCLMDADALPSAAAGSLGALSGKLKAVDFGCSQQFGAAAGRSERLSKRTGTLAFMAPEIFDQDFSAKADVWSVGVTLYWLFSGRLPYWGAGEAPEMTSVDGMAELARSADIDVSSGAWEGMSAEGRSFVKRCLCRDEARRLSVDEALAHPWIQRWAGGGATAAAAADMPATPNAPAVAQRAALAADLAAARIGAATVVLAAAGADAPLHSS